MPTEDPIRNLAKTMTENQLALFNSRRLRFHVDIRSGAYEARYDNRLASGPTPFLAAEKLGIE